MQFKCQTDSSVCNLIIKQMNNIQLQWKQVSILKDTTQISLT